MCNTKTAPIWDMETHHLFIMFYYSVWLFQEEARLQEYIDMLRNKIVTGFVKGALYTFPIFQI